MCGIAGFFSPKNKFSEHDLFKMTQNLAHRGPDAEGFFYDELCGLGHQRLSILDLSEGANQPMWSANKRFVCVYNGEIYNFREIKLLLGQEQITFKTTSDTEVLIELFVKKGTEFVKDLNGIFAIAIYDTQQKKLFLFRDRLGVKPLYYYSGQHNFAFASELKSLLTLGLPKVIDTGAMADFLHLGYIPAPDTIFENIYKLPSGNFLEITANESVMTSYWNAADNISRGTLNDETQAVKELDSLLKSSVGMQMLSDVPLGVFLSGGIDSSIVASFASHATEKKIKTFSIGFENEKFNEAPFARKVAQHLQTDHHELIISTREAQQHIANMIDVFDEPFADSSAIPTMLVSQLARKEVKVALSGDGGDELFFGYGTYNWAAKVNHPVLNFFDSELTILFGLGSSARFRKAKNMFGDNGNDIPSHIFSQEQGFFF